MLGQIPGNEKGGLKLILEKSDNGIPLMPLHSRLQSKQQLMFASPRDVPARCKA